MQRRRVSRWLCFVLAFVISTGIAWFVLRPQKPIGERVTLSDGTEFTLHAITHGKEHYTLLGRTWEIILDRVPEKLLPQWIPIKAWRAGLWKGRLTFPDDKLVVWFAIHVPTNALAQLGIPLGSSGRFGRGPRGAAAGVSGIPWRIVGPEGSELGGMIDPSQAAFLPGMTPVRRGPVKLYPVVIHSYPRRFPEITFKLYQPIGPHSVPGSEVPAKEFIIKNPNPTEALRWNPEALPIRREMGGLTCVLRELNIAPQNPTEVCFTPSIISPNMASEADQRLTESRRAFVLQHYYSVGSSTHSRIVFELFQDGARATNWAVQMLTVLDPTGNVVIGGEKPNRSGSSDGGFSSSSESAGWSTRFSSASATGAANFLSSRSAMNQYTCLAIPLWLDEPAWKIQVDLVQTGDFPTKNCVRLEAIPFPPKPESRQLVRESQMFGRTVKIYSVGARDPNVPERTMSSMTGAARPYPSLEFEFDPKSGTTHSISSQSVKVAEIKADTGQRVTQSMFLPDVRGNLTDNWHLVLTDPSLREKEPNVPGRLHREINSIDITLAVPEQRTFEFLAKPTGVKPAEKAEAPR